MDLTPFINEGSIIPLQEGKTSPTGLALDSRKVQQGSLFLAIPGEQHDGALFIEDALKKGASCIVTPEGVGTKILSLFQACYPNVSFFEAPHIRKLSSQLAATFYPQQPDTIVAITGTNGKTSVASFLRQLWHEGGYPAASLGNLGLLVAGKPPPPAEGTEGMNTPDPITLHSLLQDVKEAGINHLAFEATSHGLTQHRLDGVRLKAAVFTNFTNDHLDYHHTLEAYFNAKKRLFEELMHPQTFAILNTDIPEFETLLKLCQERSLKPLTFGKKGDHLRLISIIPKEDSQDILLSIEGKLYNFSLPLVGEFQSYNVLAALGAALACGGNPDELIEACLTLKGVPGRLEKATPNVYVDYAHTPDSLSVALSALRPHTKGNLWVVFGCGGNRDPFKRPMMGEIADRLADKVIITDDNPRHEDPADIRKQVCKTCPKGIEIFPRGEAISTALHQMQSGDVVLIAGKGHETMQMIKDHALPFNDVDEVKRILAK